MNKSKTTKSNYTYIVKCADGTLYCGWTNDLEKRISDHNAGKGAKYTKPRLPVKLVYFETFDTKEEAMSREWHIKHLPTLKKKELIKSAKKSVIKKSDQINSQINTITNISS